MDRESLFAADEYHGCLSWTNGFYFNIRLVAATTELSVPVMFQFDAANVRVKTDHLPWTSWIFFQIQVKVFSQTGGSRKMLVWTEGGQGQELIIIQGL